MAEIDVASEQAKREVAQDARDGYMALHRELVSGHPANYSLDEAAIAVAKLARYGESLLADPSNSRKV